MFLALQAVFGFAWLFLLPYFMPFAIEADATRRTALLGNAANLVGGGARPIRRLAAGGATATRGPPCGSARPSLWRGWP